MCSLPRVCGMSGQPPVPPRPCGAPVRYGGPEGYVCIFGQDSSQNRRTIEMISDTNNNRGGYCNASGPLGINLPWGGIGPA